MINFWKLAYKEVKEQRDQLKAEREKFEQMLNEECERGYQMEGKYHDMKAERNNLVDDLSWYKEKVSRLERENYDFKKRNALLMNTVDDLDKENKALRLQSDTYFDEWQEEEKQKNNYKDIWQMLKTETLKQLDTESERLKRAEKELDNDIDNSYIIGKITGQRVELINVLLTISSLDGTNEFINLLSDTEDE